MGNDLVRETEKGEIVIESPEKISLEYMRPHQRFLYNLGLSILKARKDIRDSQPVWYRALHGYIEL